LNFPDQTARITSYGNSFTMCNQVNDGETCQEYLAARLGEPVMNFGVGGYSVYQAYLRLLREEKRMPSECIIFNIWEDDHYRNLDAWKSIRKGSISIMGNGFAMPYLEVEDGGNRVVERPNPTPTPESVYHLGDPVWVEEDGQSDTEVDVGFRSTGGGSRLRELQLEHSRKALRSTEFLVEQLIGYAAENGKKILFVLSYTDGYILDRINGDARWDESFVAFLEQTGVPVADMSQAHLTDYRESYSCSPEDYLGRFFIGHYNPVGNHFMAMAIRDQVASLLDPRPPAYA
jgi:hypothetical protein